MKALLRRGTDDFFGNFAVHPLAVVLLKGFFHQAIFARVKCQNGGAPAGFEDCRQLFQKGVERFELAVDIDSQRLKGSLAGLFDGFLTLSAGKKGQRLLHKRGQLPGGIHAAAPFEYLRDGVGDALGIRLIGIFNQQGDKLLLIQLPQPLRRRLFRRWVQPKVQRPVVFIG